MRKATRYYVDTMTMIDGLDLWPGDVVQVGYGLDAVCWAVNGLGGLDRVRAGVMAPRKVKASLEAA